MWPDGNGLQYNTPSIPNYTGFGNYVPQNYNLMPEGVGSGGGLRFQGMENWGPKLNAVNPGGLGAGMGAAVKPDAFSWDGAFGKNGWAGTAMQGLNVLGQGIMGMKQLSHAKSQLDESKRQFNMNWEAQKNLTNNRLEDRQRARVASNAGAYQSVGDYMNKYGVK